MPVVEGAAEAARSLAAYLAQLAVYEANLAVWQRSFNQHAAMVEQHRRALERYQKEIVAWNADRSLGTPVGGRPVNPGMKPADFHVPRPVRPIAPAALHHQVYQNTDGQLPAAPRGYAYHEAQVSQGRDGTRGQHRVVVLADDATGAITKRYCTSDHYGDNRRSTRVSFTSF